MTQLPSLLSFTWEYWQASGYQSSIMIGSLHTYMYSKGTLIKLLLFNILKILIQKLKTIQFPTLFAPKSKSLIKKHK